MTCMEQKASMARQIQGQTKPYRQPNTQMPTCNNVFSTPAENICGGCHILQEASPDRVYRSLPSTAYPTWGISADRCLPAIRGYRYPPHRGLVACLCRWNPLCGCQPTLGLLTGADTEAQRIDSRLIFIMLQNSRSRPRTVLAPLMTVTPAAFASASSDVMPATNSRPSARST